MSNNEPLPDWERVLSAAAHLQQLVPGATLVGGTAAALYAEHRQSMDADHVVSDLQQRFDDILANLESVAGWKTARINRPVQILGSLDGIETGIRQLVRKTPLETTTVQVASLSITLPTEGEMLRVKAVLVLRRNAARDYIDVAALSSHLGQAGSREALRPFDTLYPQPSGESALMQLQVQLADPRPFDLDEANLKQYKGIKKEWSDWKAVSTQCRALALDVFRIHDRKARERDDSLGY